jgi:hypothetical protein
MSSFHCVFASVLLLSMHILAPSLTMGDELDWYVYRTICGNHRRGQAVIYTLKKRWVLLPPCLCANDTFTHLFGFHVESKFTHQWIVLWHFNCVEDCLICSVEHVVSSSRWQQLPLLFADIQQWLGHWQWYICTNMPQHTNASNVDQTFGWRRSVIPLVSLINPCHYDWNVPVKLLEYIIVPLVVPFSQNCLHW